MSTPFGSLYAGVYDVLYQDKNYENECNVIENLFKRFATAPVATVLDLGSGTGNHAFPLASRGFEVVGVERSEGMLRSAEDKRKRIGSNGRLNFQQGDIRTAELGRRFDAALMMFAVLGYQHENSDVLAALRTARAHLNPGGLFIFDVWYGPAVLHQQPGERVKVIPDGAGKILRVAGGELDVARHLCTVKFHLWRIPHNESVTETEETHVMRYFFPQELNLFLTSAGFAPVRLGVFPEFDKEPDMTTWNVLGVARAV